MVTVQIHGINSSIKNCYEIGNSIQSNFSSHLIIDNYDSRYVTLSNNYVIGDITKAVGRSGNDVSVTATQVQSKSVDAFTKPVTDTSSVTYLLNGNKSTGSWAQGLIDGKLINEGYPYLVENY